MLSGKHLTCALHGVITSARLTFHCIASSNNLTVSQNSNPMLVEILIGTLSIVLTLVFYDAYH